MAGRKLRIACVLALGILGFGRYVEAASVTLAWDHSTSSNVSGYQVSYGTQSGKYAATVKAGYVTSVSINGLTDGTTYYFIVQSYDSAGTVGSPSPEISGKAPTAVSALSISCPSPVLTSPDGQAISVTLTPTVSGGVAPISTSCSPASGSLFSVGTTSFTCTAVDAAQQKASCTSNVVVAAPTEPTEPTLVQPTAGEVTLVCPTIPPVKESGQSGKAAVEFANPVFSDGTMPVTVSCSPKSGSQFRIGTTTVACSATSAAGESFACTTTVTVTDRPKLSNGG
jgi:hypothetical protein